MHAQFYRQASQDQQPENDHKRQVEAAERGRIDQRKGEEQSATGGQQPDLVAVPDRADRADRVLPVGFRPGHEGEEYADAQIEAV